MPPGQRRGFLYNLWKRHGSTLLHLDLVLTIVESLVDNFYNRLTFTPGWVKLVIIAGQNTVNTHLFAVLSSNV